MLWRPVLVTFTSGPSGHFETAQDCLGHESFALLLLCVSTGLYSRKECYRPFKCNLSNMPTELADTKPLKHSQRGVHTGCGKYK